MVLEYIINEQNTNMTIKDILRKELHISNRLLTRLKLDHRILVNANVAMVNNKPRIGDRLSVNMDFIEEDDILPQKGELDILYEDDYMLAVNKPSNLVVHPCSYHPDGTLANFVKYYLNNQKKIRPINRLDNGTSGIVLFAKNEYVQELFKIQDEKPVKEYIAVVYGFFDKKEGTLSFPIARKGESIIEREVNFEAGQKAITHYKVLKECKFKGAYVSALNVFLETGRTHQIRVHMNYIGHPLIGDTLYSSEYSCTNETIEAVNKVFTSQALHAYRLCFKHPITHENIQVVAPIPSNKDNIININ